MGGKVKRLVQWEWLCLPKDCRMSGRQDKETFIVSGGRGTSKSKRDGMFSKNDAADPQSYLLRRISQSDSVHDSLFTK